MTNDREYLEMAAKAAGIELLWTCGGRPVNVPTLFKGLSSDEVWNPLADDGDALRLAVRCAQLFGFYRFLRAWLIAMATENGSPADPCAATRRAIVRAAAEIGKGMK